MCELTLCIVKFSTQNIIRVFFSSIFQIFRKISEIFYTILLPMKEESKVEIAITFKLEAIIWLKNINSLQIIAGFMEVELRGRNKH